MTLKYNGPVHRWYFTMEMLWNLVRPRRYLGVTQAQQAREHHPGAKEHLHPAGLPPQDPGDELAQGHVGLGDLHVDVVRAGEQRVQLGRYDGGEHQVLLAWFVWSPGDE